MKRAQAPAKLVLTVFARTRRRALWLGAGRALGATVVGLLAGLLAAGSLLPVLPEAWRPWYAAGALLFGVGAGLWLGRSQWRAARPLLDPVAATELLVEDDPAARDELLTALDLAAWDADGAGRRGASVELVAAAVGRAAAWAPRLQPDQVLPAGPLWGWLAGAVLAVALGLGWLVADPAGSVGAWAELLRGGPPRPVTVANLTLTYAPPAYTGLPEQRVEGSDGFVEAYPGTRVTLEGTLSRPLPSGVWRGPGGTEIPLALEDSRFRVAWILGATGSYEIEFRELDEGVPSDFGRRRIAALVDARPTVGMSRPEGDLEVTTDQEIEVTFTVRDDFRVERAELVLQGDQEVRVPLHVTPGAQGEGSARFLPLSRPELGEGAYLRIDAWDNDTVSGPKAGMGPAVYVSFLDKRRLAAEIEGLEERLFEALLVHLADHLDLDLAVAGVTPEPAAPAAVDRLRRAGADLLALFEQLLTRVQQSAEEGVLGAVAVLRIEQGFRAALDPFLAGGEDRSPVVAEVERDILFLDRLLQSLRMEQALSMGDELSALQRSLFDELQAGGSMEELAERVDQIERLLQEMASRLSQGAEAMPEAFANADAVQNMPTSEVQDLLQQLREALQRGDREQAEQLAEQLLEALSRWMAALEEAAQGAGRGELDPMLQELAELENEVHEISAAQERLLEDAQATGREASRRAAEMLRDRLQEFLQRQELRLQEVERAARMLETLSPRGGFHGAPQTPGEPPTGASPLELMEARRQVSSAIQELRQALREDLARAGEGVNLLEGAFSEMAEMVQDTTADPPRAELARQSRRQGETAIAELQAELGALGERRLEAVSEAERQQLGEQGQRQEALGERTGELGRRLQEFGQKSPFLGPGLPQRAENARQAMRGAGQRLGGGDPFGAVPQETRALEELAEISQQLEGAREQMQQGGGQGMQVMRSGSRRPGGRDVDRSRVEIPREMEARELRRFREDVLRAMREGEVPEEYQKDVQRYYESLIR